MFSCKCCVAKDRHINDLKEEVATLLRMLEQELLRKVTHPFPVVPMSPDSAGKEPELTQDQILEMEAAERERDQILSGTY